ncbi:MAG: IS630 family transposase [Syntrophobacteraceae bacterium]
MFFQDEARFGRISDLFSCWAPEGMRPVIQAQIIRQYTHVFGAVCPNDGESFSLILPYADSEAMEMFLAELSKQYDQYRLVLVMDQASWHRTPNLLKFENIRIIYQPPHSPELNPAEHLWEHIREKFLRNAYWTSMELLEAALEAALIEVEKSKSTIQSLVGFHWAII